MLKFIKLLNGEEIIAEVDDGDDWCEKLELRSPMRNIVTPQGSMLIPYPCDAILVIVSHVLFTGIPNSELTAAYCQATGKIISPPRNLLRP
jgi:hypothetical protein